MCRPPIADASSKYSGIVNIVMVRQAGVQRISYCSRGSNGLRTYNVLGVLDLKVYDLSIDEF